LKIEGLRSRAGKTSIQAAMELKAKRDSLAVSVPLGLKYKQKLVGFRSFHSISLLIWLHISIFISYLYLD
jgi:hypothetical protein